MIFKNYFVGQKKKKEAIKQTIAEIDNNNRNTLRDIEEQNLDNLPLLPSSEVLNSISLIYQTPYEGHITQNHKYFFELGNPEINLKEKVDKADRKTTNEAYKRIVLRYQPQRIEQRSLYERFRNNIGSLILTTALSGLYILGANYVKDYASDVAGPVFKAKTGREFTTMNVAFHPLDSLKVLTSDLPEAIQTNAQKQAEKREEELMSQINNLEQKLNEKDFTDQDTENTEEDGFVYTIK